MRLVWRLGQVVTSGGCPDGSIAVPSVEVEVVRAAPLQLVEVRVRRDRDEAVPQGAGLLAARGLAEHRAEERRALEGDRRRADLVAHLVHAEVVRLRDRL